MATRLFRWALDLELDDIEEDPLPDRWRLYGPMDTEEPVAVVYHGDMSPAFGFPLVKYWIHTERPIMAMYGGHHHVIVGYCEENPSDESGGKGQWLYVYDPLFGPMPRMFSEWKGSIATSADAGSAGDSTDAADTDGIVWVGPPSSHSSVRFDEPTMWTDNDQSGTCDYEEPHEIH